MNRAIAVIFAVIIAANIILFCGTIYYQNTHSMLPQSSVTLQVNQFYPVKRIKVLDGHLYDVILADERRFFVKLAGVERTPVEAKAAVIKHLNECQQQGEKLWISPKELLSDHGMWEVEVYFTSERDATLTDWLRSQQLLYDG